MSGITNIFVISPKAARLADLVPGAASLGGSVTVISIDSLDEAENVFSLGARTLLTIPPQQDVIFEDYSLTIAAAVKAAGGKSLVILPADRRGKAMAVKLGVALNAAVINEASAIETAGTVTVKHLVYGGLAIGVEESGTEVTVVTVPSGVFETQSPAPGKSGETKSLEFIAPEFPFKLIERKHKPGSSVDLGKAKRVVGVGRGFSKEQDLRLARELAAAIDAEVGCSRPIAEGEHWMERERYIGVSGVSLKTEIYFTLGISGQIQHMVGANESKIIIAVNKDKNAPIFGFADYGIVGDLYKVVPAVTKALKG